MTAAYNNVSSETLLEKPEYSRCRVKHSNPTIKVDRSKLEPKDQGWFLYGYDELILVDKDDQFVCLLANADNKHAIIISICSILSFICCLRLYRHLRNSDSNHIDNISTDSLIFTMAWTIYVNMCCLSAFLKLNSWWVTAESSFIYGILWLVSASNYGLLVMIFKEINSKGSQSHRFIRDLKLSALIMIVIVQIYHQASKSFAGSVLMVVIVNLDVTIQYFHNKANNGRCGLPFFHLLGLQILKVPAILNLYGQDSTAGIVCAVITSIFILIVHLHAWCQPYEIEILSDTEGTCHSCRRPWNTGRRLSRDKTRGSISKIPIIVNPFFKVHKHC